jgi:hypothetical protein
LTARRTSVRGQRSTANSSTAWLLRKQKSA